MLPPQARNLTGLTFNRLTVIEYQGTNKNHNTLWKCQCTCGNTTITTGSRLFLNLTKSCGCLKIEMSKLRNSNLREKMIGKTFGKLTVVNIAELNPNFTRYNCICQCGNYTIVRSNDLNKGDTKSCGCHRKESMIARKTTHGLAYHPLYDTWNNMIQRCYNPKASNFEYYGGKGVTVCDEWKNDPQAFISWAEANGQKPELTIERINNNGNYEPSNCTWATMTEQNRHQTSTKLSIDKVKAIRKDDRLYRIIGDEYGVSETHIGQIKLGRLWKDDE